MPTSRLGAPQGIIQARCYPRAVADLPLWQARDGACVPVGAPFQRANLWMCELWHFAPPGSRMPCLASVR